MIVNRYIKFVYKLIKNYTYCVTNRKKFAVRKSDYIRLGRFHKEYRGIHSIQFNSQKIYFTAPFWFLHSVDEIFVQEIYKFKARTEKPYILDCGANIGLSLLYFKQLYQNAEIVAFEADKDIHKQLEKNIAAYTFNDVTLINAAVWIKDGHITFSSEGSLGGKVDICATNGNLMNVPTIRLRDYLSRKVDFLKIDIEGAEYTVLKDCCDLLGNVENLFVEYHVLRGETQNLPELLTWISDSGFKYYIKEAWNNMSYPFLKSYNDHYQMQLNISCYR